MTLFQCCLELVDPLYVHTARSRQKNNVELQWIASVTVVNRKCTCAVTAQSNDMPFD